MASVSTGTVASSLPLGAYTLPGRVEDPRSVIGEAHAAEQLGLRALWIGERYGNKDAAVLGGAIAATTSRIGIGTAVSLFLFRHPLSLASMASTLQAVSGGRFQLGVGRSVAPAWRAAGLPQMTNVMLGDLADIHRRLLRGEKVRYDGPAGRFPSLRLVDVPTRCEPAPLLLGAIGPRTLELAGRSFDGAILHPFLTVEAVARSVAMVRASAASTGRDPDSVKVVATVVTAPDLTDAQRRAVVGGRAVTYFQIAGFGELLAGVNGWDVSALSKLRAHPVLATVTGLADSRFTKDDLADVSDTLPGHWLSEGAAVGSAAQCAARLAAYVDAGADEVIVHGAVPELLGPTVQHYRALGAE
jgi:5,10-methylenetetrahydromethanopterin reductase